MTDEVFPKSILLAGIRFHPSLFLRSRHPEGAVHGDSKDLGKGECYFLQNKILRLRLRSAQNDGVKGEERT